MACVCVEAVGTAVTSLVSPPSARAFIFRLRGSGMGRGGGGGEQGGEFLTRLLLFSCPELKTRQHIRGGVF